MRISESKILSNLQKKELFGLWNNEYPETLNFTGIEEFEDYLRGLKDHYHILLTHPHKGIVGWYFDFIREDKRWFLLILDSNFQTQGLGSKLLDLAKTKRQELHGWVIPESNLKKSDGRPYGSPIRFYKKQGFDLRNNERLEKQGFSAVKIVWQSSPGFRNKVR
ncbi:GNAT family N-acetyltransferase [Salegentibacter chungangensis]|uniref:GNAT family N-acetyltransferase n=1 Tax=Salegentibacter chungangensis TaxID=1335724 RepID=A0ABW3NR98_9FLAO